MHQRAMFLGVMHWHAQNRHLSTPSPWSDATFDTLDIHTIQGSARRLREDRKKDGEDEYRDHGKPGPARLAVEPLGPPRARAIRALDQLVKSGRRGGGKTPV